MQKKARRWKGVSALGIGLLALACVARVWPGRTTSGPVPVAAKVGSDGPLLVGTAAVDLKLPEDSPLAGFGLLRPRARKTTGPLFARAVSFGPFAIVALDLLEIPRALQAAISERLPGRIVWVCATHTHSGPGGYDPSPLAQLAGARRFDPALFQKLSDAAVVAVETAEKLAAPAQLRSGRAPHPELQRGRGVGATPDPTLWLIQARTPDRQRLATVAGFGAHPTVLPRAAAILSADWPGAVAQHLTQGMVLQAVGGDSSPAVPVGAQAPEAQLDAYSSEVVEATGSAIAGAQPSTSAEVSAEVRPLDVKFAPFSRFGVGLGTELTTAVSVAKLGNVTLVCLPGELTGAALADLEARDPWLKDAFFVTLCGDELSYAESPRLQKAGQGERLVLFPDAVDAFATALSRPP